MEEKFLNSVQKLKELRAPFDQKKHLKNQYELFVKFEETTYPLWGLYQQAVVELDYFDPAEKSWMWGWIKGNQKWHAWNKCKGLEKSEAMSLYIDGVKKLEEDLPKLVSKWNDEQDPRIPDPDSWKPSEE